jgi:hypothetical protein
MLGWIAFHVQAMMMVRQLHIRLKRVLVLDKFGSATALLVSVELDTKSRGAAMP